MKTRLPVHFDESSGPNSRNEWTGVLPFSKSDILHKHRPKYWVVLKIIPRSFTKHWERRDLFWRFGQYTAIFARSAWRLKSHLCFPYQTSMALVSLPLFLWVSNPSPGAPTATWDEGRGQRDKRNQQSHPDCPTNPLKAWRCGVFQQHSPFPARMWQPKLCEKVQ